MNLIKRFFLSRTTIICLILSAFSAITLSALIPQTFLASAESVLAWQTAHPLLGRWSGAAGLHRMYTHPMFAIVLAGVTISLILSTWSQCLTACQRTFHPHAEVAGGESFTVPGTVRESCLILSASGYRRRRISEECTSLVRHSWGYWGSFLLHLGMLLVIAASLFIALTQQRGILHLTEGAIQRPSDPLLKQEHGLLAKSLVLPEPLRLDRLTYSFRPGYGVKQISSTLSFLSDAGTTETKIAEINRILMHRGLRVYQGVEFGHSFFVEVTGPTGFNRIYQLQIQHPEKPDLPSYNDFQNLLGDGSVVRAKYMVDAEGKSFDHVNPLLTLRLDRQGKEIGRLPLLAGGEGTIGPYSFRVHAFSLWSRLIVVNVTGMPGVFLGFFIICLGGLLHYFTPPREVSVYESASGGTVISWRAVRFAGFYQEELASLKKRLGRDETHG